MPEHGLYGVVPSQPTFAITWKVLDIQLQQIARRTTLKKGMAVLLPFSNTVQVLNYVVTYR